MMATFQTRQRKEEKAPAAIRDGHFLYFYGPADASADQAE